MQVPPTLRLPHCRGLAGLLRGAERPRARTGAERSAAAPAAHGRGAGVVGHAALDEGERVGA